MSNPGKVSRYVRKRKAAQQEAEEYIRELVIKNIIEAESTSASLENSMIPAKKPFDEVHILVRHVIKKVIEVFKIISSRKCYIVMLQKR